MLPILMIALVPLGVVAVSCLLYWLSGHGDPFAKKSEWGDGLGDYLSAGSGCAGCSAWKGSTVQSKVGVRGDGIFRPG